VLGGSRLWVGLGVGALVVRFVTRAQQPKIVYSEELAPGQAIVISNQAAEVSPSPR
jgi:hypothetical protein